MNHRLSLLFISSLIAVFLTGALFWTQTSAQHSSALSAPRASASITFNPDVTDIETTAGVAWGDVDRDGDLDLAATGRTGRGVAVYAVRDQQLSADPVWESDIFAFHVRWVDFNRDGALDLFVADSSEQLHLFLNDGQQLGDVPAWSVSSAAVELYAVALGDVTGDGWPDVVTAGTDGVTLYHNQSGSLAAAPAWQVAAGSRAVALADVNSDGTLDLAADGAGTIDLYLNSGGQLATNASWQIAVNGLTSALAWGDVNQDGRPDLAVADADSVQLVLNIAGTLAGAATWSQPIASDTLDWGDVDRDGDLDLLMAGGAGSRYGIFENVGGSLAGTLTWASADATGLTDLIWADMDNDGDLDFVSSGLRAASVLYENEQSPFVESPLWSHSMATDPPTQLVSVDIDADGDLDLAVSRAIWVEIYYNNSGSFSLDQLLVVDSADVHHMVWSDVNRDGLPDLTTVAGAEITLWSNDNGTLTFAATAPHAIAATAAWADFDGDGLLELAAGGLRGGAIYKYVEGSGFIAEPLWEDAFDRFTHIVAWADFDNDGDNDLTVADDQFYRFYRNDSGRLTLLDDMTVISKETARAAVWADVDGDGVLEFAAEPRVRLYKQVDGALVEAWSADVLLEGARLHAQDVDNDGDLDLLTSGTAQSAGIAALFVNERGTFVETPHQFASEGVLATGDFDGDGRTDLALYEAGVLKILPNPAPVDADSAEAYSQIALSAAFAPVPTVGSGPIYSGIVPIPFTLDGPTNVRFGEVRGFYSLNGGSAWLTATTTSGTPLDSLSAGAHVFNWDVPNSGLFGNSDNVVFRIEATPDYQPQPHAPVGRWQRAVVAATSQPLRVRGTQVRVQDSNGAPVPNAVVYRLPATQAVGGDPLAALDGEPFRTDTAGYLRGRGQLALGDRLFALRAVTETAKYTVYETSAAPTATGVDAPAITTLGEQVLTVSADNPLILFNFSVSLEWDASQEADFLNRLDLDIQRASEILFDLTNGQAALGDVTVYQDREQWYAADIVVYADNLHRPNANLGGIVTEPVSDTLSTGEVLELAALPGQIRMGATWNRYGQPSGTLGEDWPRVLAHEIGHYAFFLVDNYIGIDSSSGLLVPTDCQGSAMTDAYRQEYSEFLARSQVNSAGDAWDGSCENTLAELTTGRSDWETIQQFYPFLNDNIATTAAGPSLQPFAFTDMTESAPPSDVAPLASPIFYMQSATGESIALADGDARAFLFQRNDATTTEDDHIISLGSPRGQVINARGTRAGDRLCVYDTANEPPRVGCIDNITPLSTTIPLQAFADWQPDIAARPINSTTLVISVTQPSVVGDLHVQVFPSDRQTTTIIAPTVALQAAGANVYTTAIAFPITIFDAYIRVFDTGNAAEAVTRFSQTPGWNGNSITGWGGNGITGWDGNTITGWGGNSITGWGGNSITGWGGNSLGIYHAPLASPDGQVAIFNTDNVLGNPTPSVLQTTSAVPDVPLWLTPVGDALRYVVDRPITQTMVMQFRYLERDLPAAPEQQLAIYHYTQGEWQRLPTTIDSSRNLAAAPVTSGGVYALMATIQLPAFGVGWNNFGYPVATSQPVTHALASLAGSYTTLYRYETQPAPRWLLHDATVAPFFVPLVNDLTELEFGKAYWLYATEAVTGYLPVDGRTSAATISVPPLTLYGTARADGIFTPTANLPIEAWIDGVLCGTGEIVSYADGWAYKVQVSAEPLLGIATGCGAAGRVITLMADGQTVAADIDWETNQSYHVNIPRGDSMAVALTDAGAGQPISGAVSIYLLLALVIASGTIALISHKRMLNRGVLYIRQDLAVKAIVLDTLGAVFGRW